MAKIRKCPRCDLNYIYENEDYCDVCKKQMRGDISEFADYEEDSTKICPLCGVNYISEDQDYCENCREALKRNDDIHESAVAGLGENKDIDSLEELREQEEAAEYDDEENEPIGLGDEPVFDDEDFDDDITDELGEEGIEEDAIDELDDGEFDDEFDDEENEDDEDEFDFLTDEDLADDEDEEDLEDDEEEEEDLEDDEEEELPPKKKRGRKPKNKE